MPKRAGNAKVTIQGIGLKFEAKPPWLCRRPTMLLPIINIVHCLDLSASERDR